MSANATVAVWRCDAEMTATERYVLLALADEADSRGWVDGRARRKAGHLAEKTHLTRRTIDRTMKSLIDADLVRVVAEPSRNGSPGDYLLTMVDETHGPNCSDTVSKENGHTVQTPGADTSSSLPGDSPGTSDVPSSDADRLANLLADLIEQNGSKRPTVTKTWVTEVDRMIRLDERSPDLVEKCIRWCQADPFWRANIMSPAKLRKHYDRLRLASIAEKRNGRKQLDPVGDLQTLTFDETGALVQ